MVTVEVGTEKQKFFVHKDFLTACSPYFAATFDGSFREAVEKTICLDEVTPQVFSDFLNWLYSRTLPNSKDGDMAGGPNCRYCGENCSGWDDKYAEHAKQEELSSDDAAQVDRLLGDLSLIDPSIQLYVFADRYDVPQLRLTLIDDSLRTPMGVPHSKFGAIYITNYAAVTFAFKNLAPTSPLCRLLVDNFVELWRGCRDVCYTERLMRLRLPPEFLVAVMELKCERTTCCYHPISVNGHCAYHEHSQDMESIQACHKARMEQKKRKR